MANLADVSGNLTITAETLNDCKEILELIDIITKHWYYSFSTYDEASIVEVTVGQTKDKDKVSIEIPFNASGRWSFQNNASLFGAWLANTKEEENKDVPEAIRKLKKYSFSLRFEYDEDELGNQFIGEGVTTLVHEGNTPLDNMKVIEDDYHSYELTVENLVNIRGFDEDYAKSYLNEEED